MNLVEAWMLRAKEKHGSITEATKFLNMCCGIKLQPGSIYSMRDGKRVVPASVQQHMMNDCLLTNLENAGFNWSEGNFEMLRDSLSLPRRIK
jgi:hypothetical protein